MLNFPESDELECDQIQFEESFEEKTFFSQLNKLQKQKSNNEEIIYQDSDIDQQKYVQKNISYDFNFPAFDLQSNEEQNIFEQHCQQSIQDESYDHSTQIPSKQLQEGSNEKISQSCFDCQFQNNQDFLQTFPKKTKKIKKILINIKQTPIQQKKKGEKSLAFRNIKMNFGNGLIQFIQFLKEMALKKQKLNQYFKLIQLENFLLKESQNFRSFQGWRELFLNKNYGRKLRKIAKLFFGRDFSTSYVQSSKIKETYKEDYISKIQKFYQAAEQPGRFNAFFFIQNNGEKVSKE